MSVDSRNTPEPIRQRPLPDYSRFSPAPSPTDPIVALDNLFIAGERVMVKMRNRADRLRAEREHKDNRPAEGKRFR